MKQATVTIKLNKLGSNATRVAVTPAEAAIIIAEHHTAAGENPLKVVEGTEEDVDRTNIAENKRLLGLFNPKKVKNLFPTLTSPLPKTFEDAVELGMNSTSPTTKLIEHDASN